MLHALAVLAAEKAEHSKTAFYICGALLAAWAVALAAIGLSRPGFPANERAARGVMAISVLLVIGAMFTAVVTA